MLINYSKFTQDAAILRQALTFDAFCGIISTVIDIKLSYFYFFLYLVIFSLIFSPTPNVRFDEENLCIKL